MSSTLEARTLDSAELLTQIMGQKVLKRHLTPRIMFLSSMATVLVGVAYADGQLADREKIYLQKLLSQFVSPKSSFGKMISRMLMGVQRHKIYTRPAALICLTSSLSASEKLVILGFGYRLAMADGHAEAKERQYLETVASDIDIAPQQVKALFSCLSGKQSEVDKDTLKGLHWLLDPQRFQDIDPAIVNAASFLSSKFLVHPKKVSQSIRSKPSYAKLEKFQHYQEQLGTICNDLMEVLKTESEYDIFPSVLKEEVQQLAQRVQSRKFRLAVVGEFSQGKSTFLNALLGEELQPVRAIPCSGTLTVLKYGAEKRVVCHYKDGTQAVIPFDRYQEQASIPEEAALGNRELKLAESNIAEIVLEHPGLELCRYQVEIVDSPGLNEHPDRTAVTERLLQDTDAAIFLANAQRPMTKGERDLLQSLKHRLQTEDPDAPANNLFVLVNFMDLLRSPNDRAQVQTLVRNVVHNPSNPLVKDTNQVHFVSARSALEAILTRTTNEYSKPFAEFVDTLETFLAEERGELTLKKGISNVHQLVSRIRDSFKQMMNTLEGKLSLSTAEQRRILEQIGEISGFDVKVYVLTGLLIEETLSEVDDSWNQWLEDIDARLVSKAEQWTTDQDDKKEILKDYAEQFVENMSEELDSWLTESVMQEILSPRVEVLENEIIQKLTAIKHDLQSIDENAGTSLCKQFELSGLGVSLDFNSKLEPESVKDPTSFLGGLGLFGGGALAVGGLAFSSLTMFPIFLAGGLVGGVISFLGRTTEDMKQELRVEAFNKGIDKLAESFEPMLTKVVENIEAAFDRKAQNFHEAASGSISILCNLLEQQESLLRETLARKESELELIQQETFRLHTIEQALSDLTKSALNSHK